MDLSRRAAPRRPPPPIDVSKARPLSTANITTSITRTGALRPSSHRESLSQRSRKDSRAFSITSDQARSHPDDSGSQPTRAPRKSWAYSRRSAHQHLAEPEVHSPVPRYYQDAEARLRLKEYLGSPKGFEDVLEHGYPPTFAEASTQAGQAPKIGALSPHHSRSSITRTTATANNDAPKFLRSDIISWFDNEDEGEDSDGNGENGEDTATIGARSALSEFDIDDYLEDQAERSSVEIGSPVTPRANEIAGPVRPASTRPASHRPPAAATRQGPSKGRPSASLCFDRPSDYSTPISPVSPAWPGARDMTLHMTLTRPELRGPAEQPYRGSAVSPPAQDGPTYRSTPTGKNASLIRQDAGYSAGHEPQRSRGRSRSIWKKMSLVGSRK